MNEVIEKTLKNLRRNNMDACFVKDRKEALNKVKSLLKDGDKISVGGSVTLDEIKIFDLIKTEKYNFSDRYKPGLSNEEKRNILIDAFNSDVYISSSNAVTENGELINVDGNGNRVAAIIYGPKKVIIVAGVNKIVKDINEGFLRIKRIAAPKNTVRLSLDTPCSKSGVCIGIDCKNGYADGCFNKNRICCSYAVSGFQRFKDRITVILVDENLGY